MKESSTRFQPIYSKYGDDPDLGEIVEMFVDEMPDRLELLKRMFDTCDWAELERTAQDLKAATSSYGFDQLSYHAARLERAIQDGEQETEIQKSLKALMDICSRARSGAPIL
jgi:HPt (histidine-containing phosphotransfer) domain-containing protein